MALLSNEMDQMQGKSGRGRLCHQRVDGGDVERLQGVRDKEVGVEVIGEFTCPAGGADTTGGRWETS
jgi:hypothetical protein